MGLYIIAIITGISIITSLTFSAIVRDGRENITMQTEPYTMELFYVYADHVRSVIRENEKMGTLTTSRPASVTMPNSQSIGGEIKSDKIKSIITGAGIKKLKLQNVLYKKKKDLLYIWCSPTPEDMALIQRGLSKKKAPYYITHNNTFIPSGRPDEKFTMETDLSTIIPNGSLVLIQHPVENIKATP